MPLRSVEDRLRTPARHPVHKKGFSNIGKNSNGSGKTFLFWCSLSLCVSSSSDPNVRTSRTKDELLRVLEYPATPLNSNGAERDIRAHVARRKISFGTRSESGRAARDACLGALKICNKLGVSYWDYLRDRLEVSGAPDVPRLADLITQRAAT